MYMYTVSIYSMYIYNVFVYICVRIHIYSIFLSIIDKCIICFLFPLFLFVNFALYICMLEFHHTLKLNPNWLSFGWIDEFRSPAEKQRITSEMPKVSADARPVFAQVLLIYVIFIIHYVYITTVRLARANTQAEVPLCPCVTRRNCVLSIHAKKYTVWTGRWDTDGWKNTSLMRKY